ncbi:MAG: 4-hydroxy-3-methylbut-2-enyl diphosphate reductase [Candidatus Bipolaricaulia bacterium]
MEIELVRPFGFCSGVRRIIGMVEHFLKAPEQLYCLGELIHNPGEVARLGNSGLRTIRTLEGLPEDGRGKRFLIRAHGISPKARGEVARRGYEIVDGTCPLVTAVHRDARQLAQEGYRLVIVGHRDHPEVQGILGEVPGAEVVLQPEELQLGGGERLGVISQTTHLPERLVAVVAAAVRRAGELRVINTLCGETELRQRATRELAQRVELLFVVGGRTSSNTTRLTEIATRYTRCYHIESPKEIERRWLMEPRRIGISGGTSTPERIVLEVKQEIEKLAGGVNDGGEDGRVCHG